MFGAKRKLTLPSASHSRRATGGRNAPSWLPFLLPVLIGALLRLGWVLVNPHLPVWDEIPYHELTTKLAAGAPYGLPFWPPGYPLVLSIFYRLFGSNVIVGLWFNAFASILTMLTVSSIAQRLFSTRVAILSLWVVALMPSFILPIVLLKYEVWMQCLLALGLWFALRGSWTWTRIAAIAATTALLTLMRPFWLLLPVLLWLCTRFTLRQPVRWSSLAAAQVLALLFVTPWLWYSSDVAGHIVPVSMNGGMNLWIGNNPDATGRFMEVRGEFWAAEFDSEARQMALNYIRANPGHILRLLPVRLWYSLDVEPGAEWVFASTTVPYPPDARARILALMNLTYWLVSALAIVAVIILLRRKQGHLLVPLILLAFSVATQLPFWGSTRFRWVAEFLIIIFAANLPTLLHRPHSEASLAQQPSYDTSMT